MVTQASAEILEQVEALLGAFPEAQADALRVTRQRLHELLPTAVEDMSWGMPTLRIGAPGSNRPGIIAVSLLGFTEHNSLFPGPEAIALMGDKLDGFTVTKGTIHFDRDRPCTKAFLKHLVAACVTAINGRYPKKSGQFLEFYPNGVVKAQGTFKGDEMHGPWTFYRTDGTRLRSGRFANGVQTGKWVTYDASGEPYKTTHFA